MPNTFTNAQQICSTALTDVYTCPSTNTAGPVSSAIVTLLQASNTTSRSDVVTVLWTSSANGNSPTRLSFLTPVPAFQTTGLLTGKLVLLPGDKIRAQCGTASAIELSVSILETSAAIGGSGGVALPDYIQPSVAPPLVSSFTALNQVFSTAVDSAAGIYMTRQSGNVGQGSIFALITAAPPTPYSLVVGIIPVMFRVHDANDIRSCGVCFSDGTKLELLGPGMTTYTTAISGDFIGIPYVDLSYYAHAADSAPSTSINEVGTLNAGSALTWLKLRDDGVNKYGYLSLDGINWRLLHQEPRATTFTPSFIGLYLRAEETSWYSTIMTVASWQIGA